MRRLISNLADEEIFAMANCKNLRRQPVCVDSAGYTIPSHKYLWG